MSIERFQQPGAAYLVDLALQIQADKGRTEGDLHRRDRELARRFPADLADRRALLRAWLDALRASESAGVGRRFAAVFRLVLMVLGLLGLGVGGATAATVLHYDGTSPVNVMHVLVVFVGGQLLLLVLLGLVLLPTRWVRWAPGMTAVQDGLSWLSPGQLARWAVRRVFRRLPGFEEGDGLAGLVAQGSWRRVQRWGVILAAQVFAVAFNVGALITCLGLVVFTDLAFAWSTTLEPDVPRVHRVCEVLSWPWAHWVPEAVPSTDLIRGTLYYRGAPGVEGGFSLGWGRWWPFLVACLTVYGLLPRLVLLVAAWLRLRRSVAIAFLETAGVEAIVDRLRSQWVATQAVEPETGDLGPDAGTGLSLETTPAPAADGCWGLISWGGLPWPEEDLRRGLLEGFGWRVSWARQAGGRMSPESEAEALTRVREADPGEEVAVLVRAWEPPLLEFLDFLADLRQSLGTRRGVVIVPVGLSGSGGMAVPAAADTRRWAEKVRGLEDPAVRVQPWPQGAGP